MGEAGTATPATAPVERVIGLLERSADGDYIGEGVSQLEHALQAASLARAAGAPDCEILAALLHDVGHLCAPAEAPRMGGLGVLEHEAVGARWLASLGFRPDVTELVRDHVAAKRYLVTTRSAYRTRLSSASRRTLEHQGGEMDADGRAAFEADLRYRAKLRLRGWDEAAKVPGARVDGLEAYRSLLHAHLR